MLVVGVVVMYCYGVLLVGVVVTVMLCSLLVLLLLMVVPDIPMMFDAE